MSSYLFKFSKAKFNDATRELELNGEKTVLAEKPAIILRELLLNPRTLVEREELFHRVWPDNRDAKPGWLNSAIDRLKSALGEDLKPLITTIKGRGYKLDCDVEAIAQTAPEAEFSYLKPGDQLPGLEGLTFQTRLSVHPDGRETWRCMRNDGEETRIVKLCNDEKSFLSLKREMTSARYFEGQNLKPGSAPRVLEASMSEAPFYLIFEDLGTSLDSWSRDGDRLKRMEPEERFLLAKKVAVLIADFHSIGLRHSDIKPSNILVRTSETGSLRLALADFGNANPDLDRLDELGITPHGFAGGVSQSISLGTAYYRAPEVERGETANLDSDVFSLGILLYQILIGDIRKRLSADWEADLENDLLVEDIRKAILIDRTQRTGSATELADSLERLKERAEEAEQNRIRLLKEQDYQKQRERTEARRPLLIAAITFLLIGFVSSSWAFLEMRSAKQLATDRLEDTRALSTFMMFELYEEIVTLDKSLEARKVLAQTALTYLDKLSSDEDATRDQKIELAIGYQRLADIMGGSGAINFGVRDEADKFYRRAEAILDNVGSASPLDPNWARAYIQLHRNIGTFQWVSNQNYALAHSYFQNAASVQTHLLSSGEGNIDDLVMDGSLNLSLSQSSRNMGMIDDAIGHAKTGLQKLSTLDAQYPETYNILFALAHAHVYLGEALTSRADYIGEGYFLAMDPYTSGIEILEELATGEMQTTLAKAQYLNAFHKRARAGCFIDTEIPATIQSLKAAEAYGLQLMDGEEENNFVEERLLYVQEWKAICYLNSGDPTAAERVAIPILERLRSKLQDAPNVPLNIERLVSVLSIVARAKSAQSNFSDACELYREADDHRQSYIALFEKQTVSGNRPHFDQVETAAAGCE